MFGHDTQTARERFRRTDRPGTLAYMRAGETAVISSIPDDVARAQAIRFGMGAGASVRCVTTLPGGPVIVRSGRQEIAVGRALARSIGIETGCGISHAVN